MSEVKHSPLPFTLVQFESWPFDIQVLGADKEPVLDIRRYAHGTGQKSIEDCMNGVGFSRDLIDRVIETNARQLATIEFIVTACNSHYVLTERIKALEEGLKRIVIWHHEACDKLPIGMQSRVHEMMATARTLLEKP